MKQFRKINKTASLFLFAASITLGAIIAPTVRAAEIKSNSILEDGWNYITGGGGGGGGLSGILDGIKNLPGLSNTIDAVCQKVAESKFRRLEAGLPIVALAEDAACSTGDIQSRIKKLAMEAMPTIKGLKAHDYINFHRSIFNQPFEQVFEKGLSDFLHSATIPGSPLNNRIYRQFQKTAFIGPQYTPIVLKVSNSSEQEEVNDNSVSSNATQPARTSGATRGQIGFQFPLQAQLIGFGPATEYTPLGVTGQVRVGFPLYMTNQIFGEDAQHVSDKSWDIGNNRGYFYTTIAVELGSRAFKLTEEYGEYTVPTLAGEANLLMKCSTTRVGECQIQSITTQLNLDKAVQLLADLRYFYRLARNIKNGTRAVGMPIDIVGDLGTAGEVFETVVAGSNSDGVEATLVNGVTNVEMPSVHQTSALEIMDAIYQSGEDIAYSVAASSVQTAPIADEIAFDAQNAEALTNAFLGGEADSPATVQQELETFTKWESFNTSAAGNGVFIDRGILELQLGVTWLNPDAYENNNPGYKIHGTPDLFKFGLLMAYQAGFEFSTADPGNITTTGATVRFRMFPNANFLALVPLTDLGKKVIPFFVPD